MLLIKICEENDNYSIFPEHAIALIEKKSKGFTYFYINDKIRSQILKMKISNTSAEHFFKNRAQNTTYITITPINIEYIKNKDSIIQIEN